MKLSVVILSFNTLEMTRDCLNSVLQTENWKVNQDYEVIVVDNASSDGSPDMIAADFPDIKLIRSHDNLGFSRGNNLGVKNSDLNSDYVLFLNSDTIVPSNTLPQVFSFMQNNRDVGVVTSKVILANGEIDMDSHRGFPTPWAAFTRLLGLNRFFPKSHIFSQYNMGWLDLNTTHDIDSAVGAFMFVRRKTGEQIKWWDEDYFLNGEDIDFCYRVKEDGSRVVYYPDVKITHYRGASKGTRKESVQLSKATIERKLKVTNAGMDAMSIFYDKHYRRKNNWLVNGMVDFGLKALRLKRQLQIKNS